MLIFLSYIAFYYVVIPLLPFVIVLSILALAIMINKKSTISDEEYQIFMYEVEEQFAKVEPEIDRTIDNAWNNIQKMVRKTYKWLIKITKNENIAFWMLMVIFIVII